MTVSVETLVSRSLKNIGDVHPYVKQSAIKIIQQAYIEGIFMQFSSGFRSFEEQNRLYAQGRTRAGNIVTNARAGQSVHNYGLALDYFLVTDDGQNAIWTVNRNWKRVAEIAKSLGFSWGGDWKSFKDYPHIDFTQGLSWRDLKAGKRPVFPNNKGDEDKLTLQNYQWNMLKSALKLFHDERILNSDEWYKKAADKELTVSELAFLNTILIQRNLFNK